MVLMRVEVQPAFVLHAQPYRETSLLVEAFTRDHGRVGLVARGVRGVRGQPLRALLQPLQPLQLSWSGRGELARVDEVEAAGAAFEPQGEALLSTFYVNELMLRLLPRGEALPALFWRYAECLSALQAGSVAWELRRFERDLLLELGYGLQLEHEGESEQPVQPARRYRFDPERGPQPVPETMAGSVSGASLLALAADRLPPAEALRELRRLMRQVLRHHLGGRELRSWQLLADLARPASAPAAGAEDPDPSTTVPRAPLPPTKP
jgi:DNA repair protein RecO (recombination protein O)